MKERCITGDGRTGRLNSQGPCYGLWSVEMDDTGKLEFWVETGYENSLVPPATKEKCFVRVSQ